MTPLRIGSVPYLNGVPLTAWLESPDCPTGIELSYLVPTQLARQLREARLDVAMVSSFEGLRNPDLRFVPGVSISAEGAVKSVRLFSKVPYDRIRTVALDTSSLTSVALVRILLSELYDLRPEYVPHPPSLEAMLERCDAGLIIGDLKLFTTPAAHVMDLGLEWKRFTGLPFVYAGWLARAGVPDEPMTSLLTRARDWGCSHLPELARRAADAMDLPLDRVEDYFYNVMEYDLGPRKLEGLARFRELCVRHGLLSEAMAQRGA